ncbi:hypothetical protein HS088_TW22G01320 [Tripterygium wilfordii]|uniref:N-lysine methyltransferase n=1 Tax=Tripterygium wilfordii TaxID=458696 RepID=A0A7J7C0G0_TRIWF|nr:ribosomal lysine N-methyltransferase 3 [Tripterygium wilfordii]KAF5727624.1 hypothetical protein HS088_TW22G01320 [Tripterygium wilfordii]
MSSATRRLRAFKRWMKSQGIDFSDALNFTDDPLQGIAVRAVCDLKEGDVVATIPKTSCLTIKTSGAHELIESAGLGGLLGLAVALMYEKSLGEKSPWAGYLQLLPERECMPLVWTLDEVDSLLGGTELHKIVKEDKALIYEDWKENILPLVDSVPSKLDRKSFGIEDYFSAKSLIASRSFEVDDFHGSGMVPLADLFNHKTGAEDVHFTDYHGESDDDAENDNNSINDYSDDVLATASKVEPPAENFQQDQKYMSATSTNSESAIGLEESSVSADNPMVLEMIMVKNVNAGAEVFNTYGSMGNAALLHRYGFTEPDNTYDIVNIDLELVLKWSSSLFSSRYCRPRLSLWRRLDYSGCISQSSEYFEVSSDGEPQIELLVLLYIMLLPENAFSKLDFTVSTGSNCNGILSENCDSMRNKLLEMSKELLLTESVCQALMSLADMRESSYGLISLEEEIEALKRCCCIRERKLYHSMMLRVCERRILDRLRTYAASAIQSFRSAKVPSTRKRLKRR